MSGLAEHDTPALASLRAAGIHHEVVRTGPVTGVEEAAAARGIPVAALVKSIVVRIGDDRYTFVLVPGDRVIDWAKLRAHLAVRRASLPNADEALSVTGYERGAITPFGSTRAWPAVVDATLLEHPVVSLGGGAHGVSVRVSPSDVVAGLAAEVADVTAPA